MGDVVQFTKGKRKSNKTLEKQAMNKAKKKRASLPAKLIGVVLFFTFIMLQGILSMGTSHAVALSIFVVFWVSMFALTAHLIITSHYKINSSHTQRT